MRVLLQMAFLVGLITACMPATKGREEGSGPTYGPVEIYRLSFQGIHLGMPFDEACRRLRAQGYVLRTVEEDRHQCDAESILEEDYEDGEGVSFFGIRPTVGLPPLQPGSPAETVRFFGLGAAYRNGQREVTGISIYTAEPNQRMALIDRTIRDWGRPTLFANHAYADLAYGISRRQVDGGNRQAFNSCWFRPQCARSQQQLDCETILTEFSTAYARSVIYDWGRYIEVRDERENREVAGILRGRTWEEDAACAIPSIH